MLDSTLRRVFAEVFNMSVDDVVDDLSPDTIDEWDSLSHLRLVSALEEAFKTKFDNSEIMDMTNVSAIREIVSRKTAGA